MKVLLVQNVFALLLLLTQYESHIIRAIFHPTYEVDLFEVG